MKITELKGKIENAARQAFLEMFEKHGEEGICAFALYSDGGAWTVCPATNTTEHLEEEIKNDSEDEYYYLYETAAWKYECVGADKLFDEICKFCGDTVCAMKKNEKTYEKEFSTFQKLLFDTCVEVLEKLKSENFFKQIVGKEILLLFTVSDHDFSTKDFERIVTRLNDGKYRDDCLDWIKTWKRQ